MALSEINAICEKCGIKFRATPKHSFLGFQKLTCTSENCKEKFIYPLTSGYRITYWILFILMIIISFDSLSNGNATFPGGFGLAIMFALFRDISLKKKIKLRGS